MRDQRDTWDYARPKARAPLRLLGRQKGAAMVELAFALLPFLAVGLAIIDFSIPIFLRTTLTHAVREGSRYAITYRTVPGKTHTESVQDIVMQQSMGFLNGQTGRDKVKVRFYSPTTLAEQMGSDRNLPGNVVEVSVEGFQWQYMVPLWRTSAPLNIHATSSDRLEMLPRSSPRPTP